MSDERPPIHRYPLELKKYEPGETEEEKLNKEIKQLTIEVPLPRQNVSTTAAELFQFCKDNEDSDPMVAAMDKKKKKKIINPFAQKASCAIL